MCALASPYAILMSCVECDLSPQNYAPLRGQWLDLVQSQPEMSLLLIDRLSARLNPVPHSSPAALTAAQIRELFIAH